MGRIWSAVFCFGGKTGIRTLGTVARSPHFECGPIDHSGTSPFRSREEDLPRSPDPKPLFWDCKYRHIFYFRTFSCGKNHIWLKKRLRSPVSAAFPELFVPLTSSKIRPPGKMQASLLLLSPVRIFANGRTRFAHAVFSVRGRL